MWFIKSGLCRIKVAMACKPVPNDAAKRVVAAQRLFSHEKPNGPFHIFFSSSR
ncbi:hypothetical protein AB395_00006067 (plasmid) [Sinorhizobium fredii CCBAU 45436]|nr:hypothetical protein AB395_00006067 [Sinorhizobium fredii CCBAU 45436]